MLEDELRVRGRERQRERLDAPDSGAGLAVLQLVLRRRPEDVRSFLIWYGFAWPFAAAVLCGTTDPRLHWLFYVAGGFAAAGQGVQMIRNGRRAGRDRGK